ncbi:MAG: AbrB/MazE/SpoVT family DNA-binding domain-containing protein [Planctomycetes bacterium]|nr:AbrB/MazE/SpoVT family DNA-binding domain-containing protein [Planctomycetota bacterium]
MPIVKVIRNGQITLPKEFRDALGVKEGDILEAEMKENRVVLKPKSLIDKIPESEFELSEQGKTKVREALEDYKKGRMDGPFRSVKEMKKSLSGK